MAADPEGAARVASDDAGTDTRDMFRGLQNAITITGALVVMTAVSLATKATVPPVAVVSATVAIAFGMVVVLHGTATALVRYDERLAKKRWSFSGLFVTLSLIALLVAFLATMKPCVSHGTWVAGVVIGATAVGSYLLAMMAVPACLERIGGA